MAGGSLASFLACLACGEARRGQGSLDRLSVDFVWRVMCWQWYRLLKQGNLRNVEDKNRRRFDSAVEFDVTKDACWGWVR